TISTFSMETSASRGIVRNVNVSTDLSAPPAEATISGMAQRFVAMVFDDIHMSLEDTTYVRSSAQRFLGKVAPSDRVAMFATSGQVSQDFTNDHEALERALLGIVPRPRALAPDLHPCPDISYYQADLIENKHDTVALSVATEDAVQCAFQGDE